MNINEINKALIKYYYDQAREAIGNAPDLGSIRLLNDNLIELFNILDDADTKKIVLKDTINKLDILRIKNDKTIENRIQTPISLDCQRKITNTIAQSQDYFKSIAHST